ncbi:unnamed protein product [Parascedosporium putredinis]|uniref:FAM192A/Fyv6 N-terminal domain-containing protein n=1 Tax=Parascedosporium putredinis TaxID=1442378 RepID=A0A9P1H6K3_9PEZI|nr:unnamed protein product [Parascedosporium putredinis]CAI7997742.1 unnamed protein product [Parascedosporium putredinis]
MTSRFVSGGAIDSASGERIEGAAPTDGEAAVGKNNAEWEAVQKEVEETRKRREEARKLEESGEQKSLFDILQANKAAKQAAFEEKTKIRNQFRALDDDEIEFLDEVRASKRAEEERLKRETEEGLRAFRQAQKGGPGADAQEADDEDGALEIGEDWGVGRKRKRIREKDGVKGLRRRVSGSDEVPKSQRGGQISEPSTGEDTPKAPAEAEKKKPEVAAKPKLGGLVDYGSDDEDDE